MEVKQKSGSKSAAGEQDTRPLTDIHGSVCVSQCNGVVQCTENTGHKNDEKDQQNELRQGTGGRWSRELMLWVVLPEETQADVSDICGQGFVTSDT